MEWRYGGDYSQEFERNSQEEKVKSLSGELVLKNLLATLWSGETRSIASAAEIDAVGHRVVHGGPVSTIPF